MIYDDLRRIPLSSSRRLLLCCLYAAPFSAFKVGILLSLHLVSSVIFSLFLEPDLTSKDLPQIGQL